MLTDLTKDMVDSILEYDPRSGELTWKTRRNGQTDSVGCEEKHLRIRIFGRKYQAHRVIWLMQTGSWPEKQIDHIDGNTLNNKWENLRLADNSQNVCNQRTKSSRSGIKNVQIRGNKYRVDVRKNGIILRRTCDTIEEALSTAREFRDILHGEYANHG